jgi:Uma2 family endonuclease
VGQEDAMVAELHLAPATEVQRRLFTIEEYDRLHEAGILTEDDRVEFLDGELIVMSTVGGRHSGSIVRLDRRLQRLIDPELLIGVQIPLRIAGRAEFRPDLMVYRGSGLSNETPDAAQVLLVIEVADSSRTYDRNVKLPRYAGANIPEMWLLDLVEDRIERHSEPREGGYGRVERFGRGETLVSVVVPGLALDVDSLLGPQESGAPQ